MASWSMCNGTEENSDHFIDTNSEVYIVYITMSKAALNKGCTVIRTVTVIGKGKGASS